MMCLQVIVTNKCTQSAESFYKWIQNMYSHLVTEINGFIIMFTLILDCLSLK